MNRDLVTGIVGGLILVTALVGVFLYERNAGNGPASGVSPPPSIGYTLTPATGTVAVGSSAEQLMRVNASGIHHANFTLTWTATQGRDTLKLTVSPPAGSGITTGGVSQPSSSGSIRVPVDIPDGASPIGDWKVKVEFVSADPGAPIPAPTALPVGMDSSVSWSVGGSLS